MKLSMLIILCFSMPVYAVETTGDKEACEKVAKETPIIHPAKVIEAQKIAFDKCMQKRKQAHIPSKS